MAVMLHDDNTSRRRISNILGSLVIMQWTACPNIHIGSNVLHEAFRRAIAAEDTGIDSTPAPFGHARVAGTEKTTCV